MKRPTHKLRVPDEIAALVCKMHPYLKKKIRAALKEMLSDPNSGKALRDELFGLRSLRVSRFRIVYRMSRKKEIEIIAIGPRERIYEETFSIMRRRSGPGGK